MTEAGQDTAIGQDRRILYADPHAYCAHPHLAVVAEDRWLLVFNRTIRRDVILHPPQDPLYQNLLTISRDQGRSWGPAEVVPDYGWSGVECAGLTATGGNRVMLNQWRFRWYPLRLAEQVEDRRDLAWPDQLMRGVAMSHEIDHWAPAPEHLAERYPWVRGRGETWVHLSDDGGETFPKSVRVETGAYSGGYGMRGAVALPNGDLILPLSDVPHYRRIFVVRSSDRGATWSPPTPVASEPRHEFEEPAPLVLLGGRILLLLRENVSRILHIVHSDDGGATWSSPRPTGIPDYPAHLIALPDGRIAAVTGCRRPPYGIRVHLSADGGATWDHEHPVILRDDLPNKDLGYPTAALRRDGNLYVVYYAQDSDGITKIMAETVRLSER
ncbi:MAG TPA: sialidase family protein [Candidatus Cybelea sp.]|nr:sialidase family protein [Candidatus Cybelea sp.]